jgi:hypothetical protein
MLQQGECKTMSDFPPILRRVTHINSAGVRLYPSQAHELGNGNTETKYQIHAPHLYELASQIQTLASNASLIQLRSADSKPTELVGLPVKEARKRLKNGREYMPKTIMQQQAMRVLLGRKRMTLLHSKVTIDERGITDYSYSDGNAVYTYKRSAPLPVNFFLQPLPFHIDSDTGEVFDDIALGFIQECKNMGFLAELYRISDDELCAIVMLGSDYEHGAALQIAKNLASFSTSVRADWCSLTSAVHCPLSLNAECELCAWYGKRLEDSSSILQSLIDYVAPALSLEESLTASSAPQMQHDDSLAGGEEDQSLPHDSPELPDLNDQPPTKTTDWIVSAAFRRRCVDTLGTNDPTALKLLGQWFWGWQDKDTNLPIASNEILASLLGWEGRLKGKRGVVKPALDILETHTRVRVTKHDYQGQATCFDLPDIPFKLIDSAREQYIPIADPVLLGSGARVREHIKRQDSWRRVVAESSSSNYPSDVTDGLINSLNGLPANYFSKLTTTHWETMMERALCLDDEGRESALKTLRHISFFPQPIYKRATNTSRIYTVGYSYQSLQRDLRNTAFSGCLKVDLRHSQLSIACWMYGYHELDSFLNDGSAWSYLCEKSGLTKEQLKTILYASLYMRSLEFDPYSHPALKDNLATRDELSRFISVKELRALFAAREKYIKNGLETVEKDAFGNPLKASDYNVRLASLSQSYELKILSEATNYVLNLKSNTICLWLHDGFYVNGNQTKFSGISNNLKKLVEESLKEIGVISSLESTFPVVN